MIWRRFLTTLFLVVGIVLSPQRAAAATIPALGATVREGRAPGYDADRKGRSGTTGERWGPLQPTIRFRVRYDDSTNPQIAEASRTTVGEVHDCDSPRTANGNRIISAIASKNSQALDGPRGAPRLRSRTGR